VTAAILLVEDYLSLRLSLAVSLRGAGYDVVAVASAEEASLALEERDFDLIVLDWMLPGLPGIEALVAWRHAGMDLPVIMLTAKDAVSDKVKGLKSGANDYMIKPFATEELLARVEVQLRARPSSSHRSASLALEGLEVDLGRREVRGADGVTRLTTKECGLLAFLAANPRRDIPRDELLREVWQQRSTSTRSLDNAVMRLRGKVEADSGNPRHILTVHGTGYRFEP
jgi:DNA-binding response OmpR family regulator